MREGVAFRTVFLVLGALLWLASIGVWGHPVYTLCLAVVTFSWFGYITWAPKAR